MTFYEITKYLDNLPPEGDHLSKYLYDIKNLIDRKVIESGDVAWDLTPTEGNTENILSFFAFFGVCEFYLRRNSAQIMAVAVDTFSDSDVGRPAG